MIPQQLGSHNSIQSNCFIDIKGQTVKNLFCDVDGEIMGPFDGNKLGSLVAEGVVSRKTLIWKNGSKRKVTADSIPDLFWKTTADPPSEMTVARDRDTDNEENAASQEGAASGHTQSE
ncbi:MAG TPA: hypothetical protein DIW81_08160 [Planctomycetaceae bacterium]|nr:hypothetical protein [Rubinisphaera sp.]HCS51554.1 hypothetical protein [Planctomycetaceae bacterium]